MQKQDSWKRSDEIDIDFVDLLYKLSKKWKSMVICALASAVLLGTFGKIKSKDSIVIDAVGTKKEAELSEEEQQNVEAAVQLENETNDLAEYLDKSVLMQIDPYHKAKSVMLYCIDHANSQELPQITESYLNYIVNGAAADELRKSGRKEWNMDKSYAAELITAYQKIFTFPYQVTVEEAVKDGMLSESLFYVEITGKTTTATGRMAKDLQALLKRYAAEVERIAGSHRLTLLNNVENVSIDTGLQTLQHDKKALLASNRTNLKTMTDAFNKGQKVMYQGDVGIKDEEEVEENADGDSGFSIKYILSGFIGGIFLYCVIYFCWYLFHDTLKNIEELKRMYTVPFYGGIPLAEKRERKQRGQKVPGHGNNDYGKVQVQNRIRLACKKQGITKLCVASDFLLNEQEKECMDSISNQLKGCGIALSIVDNISKDVGTWDEMTEIGNVLMVCKIGTTTHRKIDDAMGFYIENGMNVVGVTAFI